MTDFAQSLRDSVAANFESTVDDLSALVAIPGIAWDAFDAAEVERSANAVAELVRDVGFADVEILRATTPEGTPGAPAIVASRPAPAGQPTVLLYAHHDVQPPGDRKLWLTEPFTAERRETRLFGRGAADDKAGIMAHLAAIRALGDSLNVGVTLFFEGEEEAGSPSFRNFLETYRAKLDADVIVVADSSNWAIGVPALTSSLRGLASLDIELATLDHAVHSGMYGGPIPDAATAMFRLLATLHDEAGNVAIDGLATAPRPELDYDEATFRKDSGLLDGVELIGTGSISERLWAKPAVAVIGLDLPDVAVASNTIRESVKAKISVRLAPGDDPESALEALKKHLIENVPFGARLEFGAEEAGKPWSANLDSPAVQIAHTALSDAFGTESVNIGLGGSIPFIADLLEVFPAAEILVTGVEDPDSRAHSANESLHLPDFQNAIVAEALLLARLGGQD
ncbi:dipeptidase [Saxibacter everestensis]|uniref:Dipeptidase n=1 Tax=Saxibacter everestensis TaxID=2909229 RepID=A0ABY8QZ68_9MICO|nr:dipeptidase [Brevibacteriaceae bacterium ZFBP1038]